MIVDKDKENSAVVPPLLPDLPSLKSALGEVFNRTLRRHRQPDGDDNLIGGLAFKLRELFIETLRCSGRDHASIIVEIMIGLWRDRFRGLSQRDPSK